MPLIQESILEEDLRTLERLLAEWRKTKNKVVTENVKNEKMIDDITSRIAIHLEGKLVPTLDALLEKRANLEKSLAEFDSTISVLEKKIAYWKEEDQKRRADLLAKFEGPVQ